ncbi:hypothetical protein ASG94_05505 [Nocardioides sp. Soil805]|nr:hypothetical protein ASG94_05505 [Nocardioides sp. Soil805]
MALLVLLAAVAVSCAYSLAATPLYIATADVLIEPSGADISASSGTKIDADEVATQVQVVTSLPVSRLVQERFSLASPPDLSELVSVQAVGTSRILRVTAQDSSPDRAARTANIVATSYLQFREQDSVGRYEQARDRLAQEQADIESRLSEVNALLEKNPGGQALQGERRTLIASSAQVAAQIDALTDSLTTAAAGGELLHSAEPADNPVSPQIVLNLILGALVGLVLGVGAALLRDRLDDVVHDEEAVRQALDAVVLARVPQWSERSHRDRLVTLVDPHSPASEEYQRLGVNVRFMVATGAQESAPIVLLTSGQESEGKTVTSCNLAVSAARLGLNVVLIDADFRRASVAPRFGLGDPPGLSDLLVSEEDPSSYLIDIGVDNLTLLPAGTLPPNPAALLASGQMHLVLEELAAKADMIVVDSPPVLTGADTLELAALADMVVVVTRERVSRRRQLVAVRETLRQVSVESVGIVYNGVGDSARATYSYTSRERAVTGTDAAPDSAPTRAGKDQAGDPVPSAGTPPPSGDTHHGSAPTGHRDTPPVAPAGHGDSRKTAVAEPGDDVA